MGAKVEFGPDLSEPRGGLVTVTGRETEADEEDVERKKWIGEKTNMQRGEKRTFNTERGEERRKQAEWGKQTAAGS